MIYGLNIPQREIVESKLPMKLRHALVWTAIKELYSVGFNDSQGIYRMFLDRKYENGIEWFEIDYKELVEQLPIMDITERTMRQIVDDLVDMNILERHPNNSGSKTLWFKFGSAHAKILMAVGTNKASAKAKKEEKAKQKNDELSDKASRKIDEVSGKGRQKNDDLGVGTLFSDITQQISNTSFRPRLSVFNERRLETIYRVSKAGIQFIRENFYDDTITEILQQIDEQSQNTEIKNIGGYTASIFRKYSQRTE